MKKEFNKIHKSVLKLTDSIASTKLVECSEEDLDILAESIELLNDMYETLYDKVFVEVEDLE